MIPIVAFEIFDRITWSDILYHVKGTVDFVVMFTDETLYLPPTNVTLELRIKQNSDSSFTLSNMKYTAPKKAVTLKGVFGLVTHQGLLQANEQVRQLLATIFSQEPDKPIFDLL